MTVPLDASKVVKKPWGSYEVIYEGPEKLIKIITVDPGQALSLQSHEHRSEHWFVLEGQATVVLDGETRVLAANETIVIPRSSKHRLLNASRAMLRVAEVQWGEVLDENDIVRYSDRYGRKLGAQAAPTVALNPPVMVCEIGCNHKGDMQIAEEMIKIAAQFCKADVIKFQKRTNRELLTEEEYNAPHPVAANAYGPTYGEHREFLELDVGQHRQLKLWCEEWGAVYSSSVWDLTSAKEIASLEPQLIKIPSAINTNQKVLDYLFRTYPGEIHVSLGMTRRSEEEEIMAMAERQGRAGDLVLYHCISGYPVELDELHLLELTRLKSSYGHKIKGIGFSGHHRGISADIAALTLGATHFERHFTLDRTWRGTDHAASLEPDGLRRLIRDLRGVSKALQQKDIEILPLEEVQRKKLKRVEPI